MSAQTPASSIVYDGNGSTVTAYPVPFKFFLADHLEVRAIHKTTGVTTVLGLSTGFTATGAGVDAGGSVLTVSAWSSSHRIEITRKTPMVNPFDWEDTPGWKARTLENNFDWLTLASQDMARVLLSTETRALRVPSDETLGELASVALRTGRFLGFGANGVPIYRTAQELLSEAGGVGDTISLPGPYVDEAAAREDGIADGKAYKLTNGVTAWMPSTPEALLPAIPYGRGNSYMANHNFYTPWSSIMIALTTASGLGGVTPSQHAVGGYDVYAHFNDEDGQEGIPEGCTHGIIQDLSTGATLTALRDHITYGKLLAKQHYDVNPECRILIRETPAYQPGHASYPGTYADPEVMQRKITAGVYALRDEIRAANPSRFPAEVVPSGTGLFYLGGMEPESNPGRRIFHDEILDDHTHPNPDRSLYETCCDYIAITGRNPTSYAAAAASALGFSSLHYPAADLATWAWRWMTARAAPVLFLTHPQSIDADIGDLVSWTVTYRSTSPVTLQWYKDGVALPGKTATTLAIASFQLSDEGEYEVRATNSEGTVASASATLSEDSGPFTPDDIDGLVQWFDGQETASILDAGGDPAADGEAVASWNSRIGSFHATQGTSGARPTRDADGINGHSCLLFDGVDDLLQHNYSRGAGQVCTLFVVTSVGVSATYQRLYNTHNELSDPNGFQFLASQNISDNYGMFGGTTEYPANTNVQGDGPVILCARRTGAGGSYRLNAVADGTFASATGGTQGRIGGFTAQFLAGRIGEILLYDTALSSPDIALVESYLATKWGITIP